MFSSVVILWVLLFFLHMVREGLLGWSISSTSAATGWEQPGLCSWSGLSLLWRFWETSQWPYLCSVSSLYTLPLMLIIAVWWWLRKSAWSSIFLCRNQKSIDFKKVDAHVHQLKGSSSRYYHSSIGPNQNCVTHKNLNKKEPLYFVLQRFCTCWFLTYYKTQTNRF